MNVIMVRAAWDDEVGVWWTESSDLHGLSVEAETLERLIERLPGVVADLLEAGDETPAGDVAIEVIAHASTRVRLQQAA